MGLLRLGLWFTTVSITSAFWILQANAEVTPVQTVTITAEDQQFYDYVWRDVDRAVQRPPSSGTKPPLLDSYLPAAMQVVSHHTDLLKHKLAELGETTSTTSTTSPTTTTTTTTSAPPTPQHRPGVYAPPVRPYQHPISTTPRSPYVHNGIFANWPYFSASNKTGYFARYGRKLDSYELLDPRVSKLLLQIMLDELDAESWDKNDVASVSTAAVNRWQQLYDDQFRYGGYVEPIGGIGSSNNFGGHPWPPQIREHSIVTKAYVSLLTLYDLLNREAKSKKLSKYEGFTENVIKKLAETSKSTAANQLKVILRHVLAERPRMRNLVMKLQAVVRELGEANSDISSALRYAPTLVYHV